MSKASDYLKKGTLLIAAVFTFQVLIIAMNSQTVSAQTTNQGPCEETVLGLPVWYKYLEVGPATNADGEVLQDSRGNILDPCAIIGPVDEERGGIDWQRAAGYVAVAILEILLRVGALVAVGFVMYGGFRFITSQGDPEGAKNARNTIINAVIGLVITIASASIVAFIANRLTS